MISTDSALASSDSLFVEPQNRHKLLHGRLPGGMAVK